MLKKKMVKKTRSSRDVYMTEEYDRKVENLLGILSDMGVDVYDVHGNPSFSVLVRILIDDKLEQLGVPETLVSDKEELVSTAAITSQLDAITHRLNRLDDRVAALDELRAEVISVKAILSKDAK